MIPLGMKTDIHSLPFDLIHPICVFLDLRSYINFSRTSKRIFELLKDENTARQCLRRNILFNREARRLSTSESGGSVCHVLSSIFDRREAIRTSQPYSASILAYATGFVYSDGILCYYCDEEIHILDTNDNSRVENIISGRALGTWLQRDHGLRISVEDFSQNLSLLSYAHGLLVFLCEEAGNAASWLLAVQVIDSTTTADPQPRLQLRLRRRLLSKRKLFVRHSPCFLYFGTHSALGDHGHHEWHIQGFDLDTGKPVTPRPLQFNDFAGSEIGSTACFGIHEGFFYAISNQTSFESEEIDWTSSYHYIRFRLEEPKPELRPRRIWRRQHLEGPINDAWTELSWQVDERTNDFLIVECRKEWHGGGSVCTRSYYTEPFHEANEEDSALGQPSFPPNDPLSRTLDSCSKPSYEEGKPRIRRNFHREYPDASQVPSHDFIRARTKHHSYNAAAGSFVDLVTNTQPVPGSARTLDRIRLRVASRLPKSPLEPDEEHPGKFAIRRQELDKNHEPMAGSEEDFQPTEIFLWPPDDAPTELFDILCPGGRVGPVSSVADDKSLVYMAGVPDEAHGNQRAIIMLSFDPRWRHPGLRSLPMTEAATAGLNLTLHNTKLDASCQGKTESGLKRKALVLRDPEQGPCSRLSKMRTVGDGGGGGGGSGQAGLSQPQHGGQQPPLLRKEKAMYLAVNRGFWLR